MDANDLTMTNALPNQTSTVAAPCVLSIIVPTFNSRSSIIRCLQSVGRQVFVDFEIVVQDNSSDDTLEIIRSFQEERPDVAIRWRCEPDTGVYDAMNKALGRCHGEWLLFLGSDDELADENVLHRMLGSAPPNSVGVLYGNVRMVGETPWAKDGALYDGSFSLEKLLVRNICHQAMFYRTSLVRRVGLFNPAYRICADWDFNLRCWSQMCFLYRDVTVANFYAGGTSSTPVFDPAFQKDFLANVRRYGLLQRLPLRERLPYLKAWLLAGARRAMRSLPASAGKEG